MASKKQFTFKKSERGISPVTFPFMRRTIIPYSKWLFNPVITQRHNMPLTGPCFIYGNHGNYLDPFLLNAELTEEPTAGVMTRDQFHKTIPRVFMDSIGIVPTSKYVPEPGIVRDVIRMIQQKRMIVIFPEGGRRWDGRIRPLIDTTVKLFYKMGVPVHPVHIHGSYLSWPRWADHYRKATTEIRWLDPLHASDYPDFESFAKACVDVLRIDEYYPPDTVTIHHCKKPAAGVQRLLYRCPETGVPDAVYSPDGVHVYSRASEMSYKMDKESRLYDRHGEMVSLIDLFDRIREMPVVCNGDGVMIRDVGTKIYEINKEHELVYLGSGMAELRREEVWLSVGSEKMTVPLESIRYMATEQNHKLTLTSSGRIFQIVPRKGSVLHWMDWIRRVQQGGEILVQRGWPGT